jgi:putative DeoR family transcriptional regulator (stage III sporulation protein D)
MLIKNSTQPIRSSIAKRAIRTAKYYIERRLTLEEIAKELGVSKTTVYCDLRKYLPEIDPELYKQVKIILEAKGAERYIKSGERMAKYAIRSKKNEAAGSPTDGVRRGDTGSPTDGVWRGGDSGSPTEEPS